MGEKPDAHWAEGPVKWLMTPEETAALGADGAERAEFVDILGETQPEPWLPDNVARTALDRRIAFADAYFQLDEQQRGSLTDPGMVFILLGPPSRTGRKPIQGAEDSILGRRVESEKWWMGSPIPFTWTAHRHRPFRRFSRGLVLSTGGLAEGRRRQRFERLVHHQRRGQFVLQRDPAVLTPSWRPGGGSRVEFGKAVTRPRNPWSVLIC